MTADVYLALDENLAARSQMRAFMRHAAATTGRSLETFADLHAWACANVDAFWTLLLHWSAVPFSGDPAPACVGAEVETARFFPNVRLNYAECLLRDLPGVPGESTAIVFRDETGQRGQVSRIALRRASLAVAARLRDCGVREGDRVVAIGRNGIEAITACLGAAAVGGAWSSVAPDLGTDATVNRFVQLDPVVLFASTRSRVHGSEKSLAERIATLVDRLPSVRHVVLLDSDVDVTLPERVTTHRIADWVETAPLRLDELQRYPFDQPLFILFSSGTTGAPKCIVHGAGGTLLEHIKEHRLHSDFSPQDNLYFHTSCGWMMWNWQVSALASGMPFLTYDGSVTFPEPTALLRILDEEGVTVFGTSPAYLQLLKDSGIEPKASFAFSRLRALQSTGSILYDAQFDWVRDSFKHVAIHSISGGTDIIGCFVLGNPLLPVFRGESQSASLGMDVRVVTDEGLEQFGTGELVCANPFPSRPVMIWADPERRKYHDSYFAQNERLWTHGDRVTLSPRGSARILGRSDGTMKIRGVRIGPAELYSVVLAIPGVVGAMAVEQKDTREPGGARIVLLVVLEPGKQLDRALTLRIKKELAEKASAVHVPGLVVQVSGLPQTLNGKLSERAARDVVNGLPPPNRSAMKNPETLDEIAEAIARVS